MAWDEEHERWWREAGEQQLRQILYWRWDPIGIADDFPWSEGEYNDYARPIVEHLRARGQEHDLVGILGQIELGEMELDNTRALRRRRLEIADFIAEWYADSLVKWEDRR